MSKPPFVMSKYLSEEALHKAAHEYYRHRCEELEAAIDKLVYAIHQNCSMCPASIDCELGLWEGYACKERIKQWAMEIEQ